MALPRGHAQLGPIWTSARNPHPPRALLALARRVGKRLPAPLFPGFDTLGTLAHIMQTGHEHSWFVLTQKIIEKEFALSGPSRTPTHRARASSRCSAASAKGAPGAGEAFKERGADFVVERDLASFVRGMNQLRRAADRPRRRSSARSSPAIARSTTVHEGPAGHRDPRGARFLGDRVTRVAKPHRSSIPRRDR